VRNREADRARQGWAEFKNGSATAALYCRPRYAKCCGRVGTWFPDTASVPGDAVSWPRRLLVPLEERSVHRASAGAGGGSQRDLPGAAGGSI
jgi:hypothetical protein